MSASPSKLLRLPTPQAATDAASAEIAGPVSRADEAAWIAAALAGNRRSFGGIYRRYVRLVHGIILSRVPLREVPDLVQDVFTTALDRLPQFRPGARFGPWIAAIARHRAIDHLRTRRVIVTDTARLSTPPGFSAEAFEAMEAILALPEAYRELLVLRLVEGMRGPEIAAHTGLTAGSVRVKLCRGMKLLRASLREADDA